MVSALIAKYCVGLSAALVAGIIQIESSGRPEASYKGSHGVMQIRLNTAKMMKCKVLDPTLCPEGETSCKVTNKEQLFHAETNVKCGCSYITYQTKRYSKKNDIIASYNLGSVFKNEDGSYTNQKYVDDVNNAIHKKPKL